MGADPISLVDRHSKLNAIVVIQSTEGYSRLTWAKLGQNTHFSMSIENCAFFPTVLYEVVNAMNDQTGTQLKGCINSTISSNVFLQK